MIQLVLLLVLSWLVVNVHTNVLPVHLFTFHHSDNVSSILDWYLYHSRIVGFHNIHAIAHRSFDTDIVRKLQSMGADIIRFDGEFADKALVLTEIMRRYVRIPAFLVPMDIDEYLVAEMGSNHGPTFTANASKIRWAFSSLPIDGFKYKLYPYMGYYCNTGNVTDMSRSVPRRVVHFHRVRRTLCGSKSFFHSIGFLQTDQGNHFGVVRKDRIECSTSNPRYHNNCGRCFHNITGLGLIHYGLVHSLTYDEYLAKAIRGSTVYNQTATSNCHKGGGQHYCEFMAMRRKVGDEAMKETIEAERQCQDKLYNSEVRDALDEFYSDAWNVSSRAHT